MSRKIIKPPELILKIQSFCIKDNFSNQFTRSYPPLLSSTWSYPPLLSSTRSFLPILSSTRSYPPILSSTRSYSPLLSSTGSYPPLLSSTRSYPPLLSSTGSYPPSPKSFFHIGDSIIYNVYQSEVRKHMLLINEGVHRILRLLLLVHRFLSVHFFFSLFNVYIELKLCRLGLSYKIVLACCVLIHENKISHFLR